MYASKNFDFKSIIEKSKKIDTKIDFNSTNVKRLKKNIISTLNIGFVIACIIGIGLYYEAMVGNLEWLKAIQIFLLIMIFGAIFSIIKVSSKMKFLSYLTLKKISKKEYEIYEYKADIQAIYVASQLVTRDNLDYPMGWTGPKQNGIVMIIDNQRIYLTEKNYELLQRDKQIILYIAKYLNSYVLYDFKRVLNENSIQNYTKKKNNVPTIAIVAIIIFIIMILLFPVL